MKIIVGLGNPGTKYEKTRHNAGFLALDYYLKDKQTISCQGKFSATIAEVHIPLPNTPHKGEGTFSIEKCFFVKPQTFMNNSGEAVQDLVNFYKADFKKDLLVIHDEIDVKFSEIKSTNNSRAAGHNGVQNIMDLLGSQEINRIRIGIEGRESRSEFPTESYVLSAFSDEELKQLEEKVLPKVSDLITSFIQSN